MVVLLRYASAGTFKTMAIYLSHATRSVVWRMANAIQLLRSHRVRVHAQSSKLRHRNSFLLPIGQPHSSRHLSDFTLKSPTQIQKEHHAPAVFPAPDFTSIAASQSDSRHSEPSGPPAKFQSSHRPPSSPSGPPPTVGSCAICALIYKRCVTILLPGRA